MEEENNNNHLEGFLKILKEQHSNSEEKINKSLFDDVCKTAEIYEKAESKSERTKIIENIRERFKNIDLNQVTDLFIYSQSFLSTNVDQTPMPSIVCINIGKLFTIENLRYTANKVYSKDELEGGCALSFLGYLALRKEHTHYILNFIKNNFKGFSQNKKVECVFQLKEMLPDNEIAKEIIKDSGITEYELKFGTEIDSTSIPITFNLENISNNKEENVTVQPTKSQLTKIKTSWWQFWK